MKVTPLTEDIAKIIKDKQVTFGGIPINPAVSSVRKVTTVAFSDDAMGFIISGNCSENIYKAFEDAVEKHGFKIVDTDGSRLILKEV